MSLSSPILFFFRALSCAREALCTSHASYRVTWSLRNISPFLFLFLFLFIFPFLFLFAFISITLSIFELELSLDWRYPFREWIFAKSFCQNPFGGIQNVFLSFQI